jgi:hypothetical protein
MTFNLLPGEALRGPCNADLFERSVSMTRSIAAPLVDDRIPDQPRQRALKRLPTQERYCLYQ